VAVGEGCAEDMAMFYVDQDRCSGCGVCVDVCPAGAITIQDGKATIDQGRCQLCEACFTACPQEAILTVIENSLVADGSSARSIDRPPASGAAVIAARVAPAVGAALLYVGREVLPWVARYVLGAVERKTGEMAEPSAVGTSITPDEAAPSGSGRHRRRRHRGA
jgi:Fe-S-cluster-containing hydrogenase component 2